MKHLPVHPTMTHPRTGAPLAALFVDKHGRARYPLMGASPDDPDDKANDDAADKGDDGKADDKKSDDKANEPAFPANTPVAEMTPAQQAAYHLHQSRKHEGRAKDWSQAFPGKTAAEIKAIVDTAEANRRNTLTLDEKTIEDAKAEARKSALAETAPKAVKAAFDLLLGDMPEKDKAEHIETLDLSKFLTDDNEVDTAKVRANVARITPAKGQEGQGRDFGQGRRGGSSASAGSVAAVMEARRAERDAKK